MNDKDIQALKALAQAANQGDWFADASKTGEWFVLNQSPLGRSEDVAAICSTNGYGEREAKFMAAAKPAAILSLISRIEQAEAALAILTQFSAKLTAIIGWLEANQPDVFRRGMWDAVNEAEQGSADAASRCRAQGGNTRDKAASPSPAVDLSGLTRYHVVGVGDCVKLSDVQALLSTVNAVQATAAKAEPVAWCAPDQNGKPLFGKGWMFAPVEADRATMPLYAAPAAQMGSAQAAQADVRDAVWREAINAAADLCAGFTKGDRFDCAAAIRALRTTSAAPADKEGK